MSTVDNRFSQANSRAWRNPWVIGWISLVVVVLGVNAFMISLAFITNPGLVTEKYYEKGRDFENNMIKRMAERNAIDWSMRFELPENLKVGNNDYYRFIATSKDGMPINGLKVSLQSYRPSDASADFTTELEPLGNGVYQAKLGFPLKGWWELTLKVDQGEQQYDMYRRRINVQG